MLWSKPWFPLKFTNMQLERIQPRSWLHITWYAVGAFLQPILTNTPRKHFPSFCSCKLFSRHITPTPPAEMYVCVDRLNRRHRFVIVFSTNLHFKWEMSAIKRILISNFFASKMEMKLNFVLRPFDGNFSAIAGEFVVWWAELPKLVG